MTQNLNNNSQGPQTPEVTNWEKFKKLFNFGKRIFKSDYIPLVDSFLKGVQVLQARKLTEKQKQEIKEKGLVFIVSFREEDLKKYSDFKDISKPQHKKETYTVHPPKKSFMNYVKGALNGFELSNALYVGKDISLEVFQINSDIFSQKSVRRRIYALYLPGHLVTDEILDNLRMSRVDNVVYATQSISFTETITLRKKDMIERINWLKRIGSYGKLVGSLFATIALSMTLSYAFIEVKDYATEYLGNQYEEIASDFNLPEIEMPNVTDMPEL